MLINPATDQLHKKVVPAIVGSEKDTCIAIK